METLTLTPPVHYRGYTIELDSQYPYSLNRFVYYPTEQGLDHDYDYDGDGYRYCGNAGWSSSIEDAKLEISDKIMESLENSTWKARTIKGVFQINFDTEYRGYKIQPVFNYSDGHSDFEVFQGDNEQGLMFNHCTLSYVKEAINDIIEGNSHDIIVKTFPEKSVGYNLTKFDSEIMARLFADKFKGEIQ